MRFLAALIFSLPVFGEVEQKDSNASSKVLPFEFRLNGKATQAAFGDARETARNVTAKLTRNDKLIAMGAIVSPAGHILTKASSCVGARLATLANGEVYKLRIKKRDEDLDLALYQMISQRNDFPCVSWS
ncbi:MAG: serine protease, partial [Verrucomicrobia bacterium]|nr:serine protease [Verrucomicrobiota bacterium]